MYKQQPEGAQPGEESTASSEDKADETVVDAEYTEVDEKEDKKEEEKEDKKEEGKEKEPA